MGHQYEIGPTGRIGFSESAPRSVGQRSKVPIIELAPNPNLPPEAQRHIEEQYDMRNGILRVPVRQASIVYFLKRYQIEEKSDKKAPHQEPLVLVNRDKATKLIPPRMRVPPEEGGA